MVGVQEFSTLLSGIYDRTGDPAEWDDLLESFSGFVGARVGQLAVFNLDTMSAPHWAVYGLDPESHRTFLRRHAREDQRLPYILACEGRVVCGEDGVDRTTFRQSALYREVIQPAGLDHSLACLFSRDGQAMATLAAMRSDREGPFDDEAASRFSLVIPHLRRAFQFNTLLQTAREQSAGVRAALDIVEAGVVLTDARLNVLYTNRTADAILKRADGIVVRRGQLCCRCTQSSRTLAAAAAAAAEAMSGRRPLPGSDHLTCPRGDDVPPYRLSLHPLPREHRAVRLVPQAEMAVIIREPGRGAVDAARRLGQALGLTPAEASLAATLAAGAPLASYAGQRGVAITTARTHLRSLFAKTGTGRQSELVATLREHLEVALG